MPALMLRGLGRLLAGRQEEGMQDGDDGDDDDESRIKVSLLEDGIPVENNGELQADADMVDLHQTNLYTAWITVKRIRCRSGSLPRPVRTNRFGIFADSVGIL